MKRQQLQEYVENLQSPHLFLTLSAADYHWDDLMRLLPNYENWKNGTSSERIKIVRENICDNPAIVAHWFHLCFTIFKQEVLTKKFDIQNTFGHLSSVLNRVQRHHCSAKYCICKERCTGIERCHFHYSIPTQAEPTLRKPTGSSYYRLFPCRNDNQQRQLYTIQEEGLTRGLSYLQKYKQRPKELEDLTFFEFLQEYNHHPNRYNRRTRANYRILIYFPIYKPQSQAEDYRRVKLLLHHPFHEVDDLKTLDLPSSFDTFAEAFNYCKEAHVHSNDVYDNDISEPESEFEDVDVEKNELQNSFNELAALLPDDPHNITELNDLSFIGNRSIDCEYNCLEHDQRLLFDTVVNHFNEYIRTDDNSVPLLINLNGKTETGKTFVITVLSVTLQNMAAENDIPSPILRAASTGVAAHTISDRTLHSIFRLPIKQTSRYEELNPQTLQAMQAGMRNIQYLIIDEKFMIGLCQLSWIDQTCKAIYSHNHHLSFDGLSVIFSDDFYQLPPVLQKPLFHSGELQNPDEINSCNLYYKFNQTIQLTVIRRQEGNDQESNQFRMVLYSLREENVSVNDWKFLAGRIQANLSHQFHEFTDAIRLYIKQEPVRGYNMQAISDSDHPVINIITDNDDPKTDELNSDEAGNLHQILPLRTQFSITIAYAITVHKSQSLSLDKAVLNITKKDFTSGLTYVTVSQVKFYKGLLFEKAFDYICFSITFDLPIHSSSSSFSQPPQLSQASTMSQSMQESDDDPYTANI
ncbi:hypothetical protein I7I51_02834 [Histoplasma capsulatum]|uniref:ATP-dependent DNA helicase n=1 Tax=Ajellomyces capsulatus TaxID=5037 RepID=A0A8A1MLE6_AJECA|nr:hypothetical protein I7I51_02834 [Histoplasma capsulatum]